MTDEDTQVGLALRARLAHLEPPVSVNPTQVRVRARARQRSRRRMATGAAVAALAGAVTVSWAFGPTIDHARPVADDPPASFSPDALVASMQASVTRAQEAVGSTAAWTLQDVRAEAGNPTRLLTGADRADARRWSARLSDGPDHLLDLILIYETDGDVRPDQVLGSQVSLDLAQKVCVGELASKIDDLCQATTTPGGIPTQYIERAGYPTAGGGWPTPNDPLLVAPIPAAQLWYLHQVKIYNPNGLTVVATEVVHTASRADAAQLWTLTPAALTQIAADPALTFPRPPKTPE